MRWILLSVDGLNIDDLPALVERMPLCAAYFNGLQSLLIDAVPHSATQPIWAELLTGKPWYQNGCYGYSRVTQSLNSLEVTTEKSLLAAAELLHGESAASPSAVINVPLLAPRGARLWLSDGSMPINKFVSPRDLLDDDLFNEYRPRPFTHASGIIGIKTIMLAKSLAVEEHRVRCAAKLLQTRPWQRCIWRLSIFDQISHLIGMHFLAGKDLQISEKLASLLKELDQTLASILEDKECRLLVLSSHGHGPCGGRLNVNNLLSHGGFLRLDEPMEYRQSTQRIAAADAVRGSDRPVAANLLRSSESRIRLEETTAVSPVSGCIFVNSKRWFADGKVDADQHESVCKHVHDFLKQILDNRFPGAVTFDSNPRPISERQGNPSPDLIVNVAGMELIDVQDPLFAETHAALTMHVPKGFLMVPREIAAAQQTLKPYQVLELLA